MRKQRIDFRFCARGENSPVDDDGVGRRLVPVPAGLFLAAPAEKEEQNTR